MASFILAICQQLLRRSSTPAVTSKPLSTTTSRPKAKIIDGKAIAQQIQDELKAEIETWIAAGNRRPQLTAILVGNGVASQAYVRNKMRAAQYTADKARQLVAIKSLAAQAGGIDSRTIHLQDTITEEELLAQIHTLNEDDNVDGILVQLPLPKHINERLICNAVTPEKDVDGFHVINVGRLCSGQKALVPATALGVIELLKRSGIETFGKKAVICGRSKNVGFPMQVMLQSDGTKEALGCDATTSVCHRYTKPEDLRELTLAADIVVVATGIPNLITADMVKEGVAVIDVGITQIIDPQTGKKRLVGDVDFKGVSEKASYITPVPGGVGPMTVAMLMKNTLTAARKDIKY